MPCYWWGLVTDTVMTSECLDWTQHNMTENWKPGFERRTEATGGIEGAIVERWSAEEVALAKEELGHEPSVEELRKIFTPTITSH